MIPTRKVLQIHRFISRAIDQKPTTTTQGMVQILDWTIMRVQQNQIREEAYPCIFARGAELFYLISSIRPFRRYNQLTALCVFDWCVRQHGFGLKDLHLDEQRVITERIRRDYRESVLQASDHFAQEYRYWFFMHSEPISKQSARSASAITSISRSLFDLNW
ncbi:hypothetical protein [Aeromonas allosaccharophila]|uniref:hypothetical protein n=1 Tax=Aeromonas allosaccharophila TaxID=656 RepID=UPI002ADF5620|nr:hypothetical protein [Aeromonas allosaccharophila]